MTSQDRDGWRKEEAYKLHFEQRALRFHFAQDPTNYIAIPTSNYFIAQPLTRNPGMKMNIYQEIGSFHRSTEEYLFVKGKNSSH